MIALREECWNAAQNALRQGDWKSALQALRKKGAGFQIGMEDSKLLCCIYLQASRWTDLASIAASAAQRFPREAIFWECWAWAEHSQGETAAALRILERIVPNFPERESLCYTLACLCACCNRIGEAERWLSRALLLSSDPRAFAKKLEKQRELRVLWIAEEQSFAE